MSSYNIMKYINKKTSNTKINVLILTYAKNIIIQ